MATDNESAPHDAPRQHMPLPVWVALGVAVFLAVISLVTILHRPGVPTLVLGHRGAGRMSTSLMQPYASWPIRGPGQGRHAAG